ncbi:MAG: PAS domain S-box protein [Candidatus Binatia bacterium]
MDDQGKAKSELIEELQALQHDFEEVKKSEEQLRLSHELSPHAFAILRSVRDPIGRIVDFEWTYANPAAAAFLSRSAAALAGQRLLSVLGENSICNTLLADYVRVAETGVPLERELYYNAHGIKNWFWHKTVKSGDGVATFLSNITARKRAEAWLQSLIGTTQDAVLSIDRHARIVLFNPAAEHIFGYTKEEVVGQKVNILMAEPYASEHDDYLRRYEQTGIRQAIGRIRIVMARRKSGKTFPIELSVTEVQADDEVQYAAFIRDITERVQLQKRTLEQERLAAIGTTAAKLAHEVGNPLNGMYLAAQILERRLSKSPTLTDETVQLSARNMVKGIARLNQLLNEFRALSRRQQYNFQLTNLTVLLAEALEAEVANYHSKGVGVELHLSNPLPPVMVDSNKFTQALINLSKNAVEAMPKGGTLTISGYSSGEYIKIEVCDTGIGIPDGVNIFEPFTTTKPEGSGLGLPIVQQIIAGHGGMLTYTSEPGKGTTFIIMLPVSSSATRTEQL